MYLEPPPLISSEVADCKTYTAEVSMRPTAAKVTQVTGSEWLLIAMKDKQDTGAGQILNGSGGQLRQDESSTGNRLQGLLATGSAIVRPRTRRPSSTRHAWGRWPLPIPERIRTAPWPSLR